MDQVLTFQENNAYKQVGKYWIYLNKKLGSGQFSEVYLSNNKEIGQMFAAKIYNMKWLQTSPEQIQSMVKKEIGLLKKIKHENLVTLHDIQMTPNNLYLFLDYCNGGTLRLYLEQKGGKLFHDQAIQFFKELIIGYQELYNNKIIHRDLKPENILLHNGKPKIADFGFGRIMEGNLEALQAMSIKCTPVYASPQMLKQQMYSSKNDVWAMGIILYELLFGKRPFDQNSSIQIIKEMERQLKQNEKQLIMPKDPSVIPQTRDLIQKMLQFEEQDRITWPELFQHPVIKNDFLFFQQIFTQDNLLQPPTGNIQILLQGRKIIQNNLIIDQHYIKKRPKIFSDVDDVRRVKTEVQSTQINEQAKQQQSEQVNQTMVTNISKPNFSVSNSQNFDGQLNNEYQNFKMNQMIKFACQNMNKLIMFNRNRAIFAYTILQYFLDVQSDINFLDVINYAIYFCLGGFYQFYLNHYYQILLQKKSQNLDQTDFAHYCKSEYYQETLQKLKKDIEFSTSFFSSIESIALNGLPRYQSVNFPDSIKQCFAQIILMAQKKEISESNIFNTQLETILINQIDIQSLKIKQQKTLKAIYGMLIFTKIDQFIPPNQFFDFDFGKFYSESLINATQEQLLFNITNTFFKQNH